MPRSLSRFSILSIVVAGFYLGCGGEGTTDPPPEDPRPSSAVIVSGDAQTGTVGLSLAAPLVVQVNDQSGNAMSGVTVSFTVSVGKGTVSSATDTTDALGQASTNWTLGRVAGSNHQVTASVSGARNVTASFSATATADDPFVLSMVSGDSQFAYMGTKLPDPIAVKVRDQYANNVPGQVVTFTLPTGRGSVDSLVAFTNSAGEAVTGWTIGSTVGQDTAFATVTGLVGSPVVFTATVHDLRILTVTPGTLELGGTATLTGSGFDPTPANNTVTLGDLPAIVNSATPTQLEIAVPDACRPFGPVAVRVTVGGVPSAPRSVSLSPSAFLDLNVGEQVIVQDPAEFCLQFEASANPESYLIGVQSISEATSSRTPVKVTARVAEGSGSPPALPTAAVSRRSSGFASRLANRDLQRYARHRAAEARILASQLEVLRFQEAALPRAGAPWMIPPSVQVGDTVDIRVSGYESPSCDSFTEIRAEVMVIGDRSIWVNDVANPDSGYTAAELQVVSDLFDQTIYAEELDYFGQPTDLDANDRVVVVTTQEVNRREGPAGFVAPLDFVSRSACAASNEGEFMYLWVPDSTGSVGFELTKENALAWLPSITAHEMVHVIQVGRRVEAGSSLPSLWEMEGQATLGEEIIGHLIEGYAVGQDLSNEVAFDFDGNASAPWYLGAFYDLFYYYGMDDRGATAVKINGAPEDCSWLGKDIGHVCLGDLIYSPSWSVLRWLSDRFGAEFTEGEEGFQRALIDNASAGFENLEAALEDALGVASVSMDTLLAQWAAMLYVDGRVLDDGTVVQAAPELQMSSWDLYSVFENTTVWDAMAHTLVPYERLFTDFADDINVRAASSAYFVVSGTSHGATAIQASNASDSQLPAHMQVWVVRMQ